MARSRTMAKLTSGFNLGGQQAESDPMLAEAFLSTAAVRAVESRTDPMTFLVGRTGSGKSATFVHIEQSNEGHIIRIDPEDLSLPYVSDSHIVRELKAANVHLDPLFIALWKHVLVVEIIRHRYGIYTPEAKQTFFSTLLDRLTGNRQKTEALKYLNEFQGKFWCTADLRIREITDQFEDNVNSVTKGSAAVPQVASAELQMGDSQKWTKQAERNGSGRYRD